MTPEFRRRRVGVWVPIGLAYASYYMCRYNWTVAHSAIEDQFGFTNGQLGWAFTASMIAYAVGQVVNGPIIDRVGGKRAILFGAAGTIFFNLLLACGAKVRLLGYFIAVWAANGYFQAFGASSLVKVNANWFRRDERGTFTGIFGLMIQIGRWATTALGGFIIARKPWPWAFIIPPIVTAVIAVLTWFTVADNPEDLGFPPVEPGAHKATHARVIDAFLLVVRTPPLWFVAGAYFCTGVVRYGLDLWWTKYLQKVHHVPTDSPLFQIFAAAIPVAAVAGSFAAGAASDKLFGARRGPPAAIMYFGQFVVLLLFIWRGGPILSGVLLVAAQFFVNGPHSLLGGAAAMDFGGRKSAGSAAGLIDCFQYIGAGLAGVTLGSLIDRHGWSIWISSLVGFALIGSALMVAIWRAQPKER